MSMIHEQRCDTCGRTQWDCQCREVLVDEPTPFTLVEEGKSYEIDHYGRPNPFIGLVIEKAEVEARVLLSTGESIWVHRDDFFYPLAA